MQDPPHALKKLRNSLFNSNRLLQFRGQKMSWCVIEELLRIKKSTRGFDYIPKIGDDAVHLTSWTKMRVGLAANVMHKDVADKIVMDVKPSGKMDQETIDGTAAYIRRVARFYEIMTDKVAFTSMDDPRFQELDEIVAWFTAWKAWVDEQVGIAKQLPSIDERGARSSNSHHEGSQG